MALVNCPSCGQQISSFADACPHCGHRSGNISDRRYYAAIAATAPVEFALASAIAGTACFALSLYLQVSHLTLDAFLVLPYHLLLLMIAVAAGWAGVCSSAAILPAVSGMFYLAAAAVMLAYSPLWTLPLLLPIFLSAWTSVISFRKAVR